MQRRDDIRRPEAQEELDQGLRADRPARADGAGQARALQRSAGNRSLSALLARDPDPPKQDSKSGSSGLAVVPEVGTIPLLSVSFGASRSVATGGSAGGGSGRPSIREISVVSRVGEHSPKLMQALTGGKPGTVEIVTANLSLTLKGAMVSSYSAGSAGAEPTESWSLNFDSFEQK
jgi:hypothetical protein